MAKVPLRLYNREIENLIDRKQTEEAAAHCRHILQIFPKHIDTYRLLGKSYLESQKYSEAIDIFQRVTSVIPDDFVSHVGMSIIREDEGNLDAAIWHMERAFEVSPANAAVQEELRRLYSRRDGVEPPKVRLTRGALVRMYANGDLYDQAVTEIRSALAEEPDRVDMQVMLARMYLANNQRIEAAEICSGLLAKYPYCWAANQILAEILPGTARAEDTLIYQQRLAAMDPYMAHVSPIYASAAEVPDNAVLVERLEWDTSQGFGPEQPGWAESLGIKIDEGFPLDIPDWLNPNPAAQTGIETAVGAVDESSQGSLPDFLKSIAPEDIPSSDAPTREVVIRATTPPEDVIPDWMKDAGWLASDMPAASLDPSIQPDAEEAAGSDLSDIVPAEIPDWVRSMAPPETESYDEEVITTVQPEAVSSPQPPAEMPKAVMPAWLDSIMESPEESPAASTTGGEGTAVIPDWLKDLETGAAEEPGLVPAASLPAEEPINMDSAEAEVTPAETGPLAEAEMPAVSLQPTEETTTAMEGWLKEFVEPVEASLDSVKTEAESVIEQVEITPEPAAPVSSEIPAEMPTFEAVPAKETNAASPDVTLPSWLDTYEEEPLEDQPAPVIPAWLDGIVVEGVEEDEDSSPVIQAGWFDESEATSDLDRQVQSWQQVEPSASRQVFQEQLEGELASTQIEPPSAPRQVESAAGQEPAETGLPDWLKALEVEAVEPSTASAEIPAGPAAELESEIPAVQQEPPAAVTPFVESLVPPAGETGISAPPAVESGAPADAEQSPEAPPDATLAWLENLASTHTSEAQTLIIRRGDRERPPQWVSDQSRPVEPPQAAPPPRVPVEAGPGESDSSTLDNWLKELEAEQQAKSPDAFVNKHEPVPKNTAALRMWLDNLLEENPVDEQPVPAAEEFPAADLIGSDQPDWLHAMASSEARAVPEETTAPEAVQPEEVAKEAVEQAPELLETPSEAALEIPMEAVEPFVQAGEILSEAAEPVEAVFSPDVKLDEEIQLPAVDVEPGQEVSAAAETLVTPLEELPTAEAIETAVPESEQIVLIEETPAGEAVPIDEAVIPAFEAETTGEQGAAEVDILPVEEAAELVEVLEPAAEVSDAFLVTEGEPALEQAPAEVSIEVEESLTEQQPVSAEAGSGELILPEELVEQTGLEPVEEVIEEITTGVSEVEQPEAELPVIILDQVPEAEEPAGEVPVVTAGQLLIPEEIEEPILGVTARLSGIEEILKPAEPAAESAAEFTEPEPAAEFKVPEPAEPVPPVIPDWLKDYVQTQEAAKAEETPVTFMPSLQEDPALPEPVMEAEEPGSPASLPEEPAESAPSLVPQISGQDWDVLQLAEKNLWGGDVETSLHQYTHLIKHERFLEETIRDLKDALYQRPLDISIWETLGDAYARNNCLQDALDAYTKAEELLR